MNRGFRLVLGMVATAACLLADVSYQETVKFTGGSMVDMMRGMSTGLMGKMMGNRLGKSMQDQTFKVYIKGNKMARVGDSMSTIVDLDQGTIMNIDNERKAYNVMTFDELRQQMEQMKSRMSHQDSKTDVQFDVKVEPTGKARMIDGQNTKEYIMTLTAEGQQGAGMKVRSDLWAASSVTGLEELRAFNKRYAEKAGSVFGGANPMMGSANDGLGKLRSETMKLEGFPVAQETSISGVQAPMSPLAAMRQNDNQNTDPNAPFLTTTSESGNFSGAAVNDSVFQVPAGYKERKSRH